MTENNLLKSKKTYKPGIFQYCDRWCEKCEHTNECLYYDVNKKFFLSGDKKFNFWDKIEDVVTLTIDDLEQVSDSMGVDLKGFSKRFSKNNSEKTLSEGYLLFEKTENYSKIVNEWFDSFAKEPLPVRKEDLKRKVSAKELAKSMQQLTKAIEYIRWYQDLISKKLKTALNSKHEFKDGFHKGFAKVVLIALDRSIDSWSSILEQFPSMSDKISNQLLLLQKIREEVEKEFPHARAYSREGLDN
jgi:soluble cytochrome b562